jgi:hypothetical protein
MFFLTFYFNYFFQIYGAVLQIAAFDHLNTGYQKTKKYRNNKNLYQLQLCGYNVGELCNNQVNIRTQWSRTLH